MLKKYITIISVLVIGSVALVGCSNGNGTTSKPSKGDVQQGENQSENASKDDNKSTETSKENDKETEEKNNNDVSKPDVNNKVEANNSKKVEDYFEKYNKYFSNDSKKVVYNGYAEYGHILEGMKTNKKEYTVSYNGTMSDGYGEDERGARNFTLTYNFKLDEGGNPMAYERVRNSDYMNENKDTLKSIIKNYIVIWGDPAENKTWEQKVIFKGKEYKAKTVMKNVSDNKYTLMTTIDNIEGFKNKIYTEERTYEKNKGLTSFSNSPYFENGDAGDLIFGYTITEQ